MYQDKFKLGLVLSGGGAKGAYEVGVVKALAKLGLEPRVVSGASIGAVNGAIVASCTDMEKAAFELDLIWRGIDAESIIKTRIKSERIVMLASLHMVVSNVFKMNPVSFFSSIAASPFLRSLVTDDDLKVLSILDRSPLENILRNTVNFSDLNLPGARDFHVSLFPAGMSESPQIIKPIVDYICSSEESEFKVVNGRPPDDILDLIMASAAIPIAFEPVKVDGKWYYDGGMGDRVKVQGNTPIRPLLDSNCTHAIVVMLGNGTLWDRSEWSEITTIEVRPSENMGSIFDIFDFSPTRIAELIDLGYRDAVRSIGKVYDATSRFRSLAETNKKLHKTVTDTKKFDIEYDSVIKHFHYSTNKKLY